MDNSSVLKQIGNTPLIKLKQASELTGCNIFAKAEYFNPGESVKDRAALFIVEDALKNKKIQSGGIMMKKYEIITEQEETDVDRNKLSKPTAPSGSDGGRYS